ncbi:MAG: tRNA (adenosine(37)-N6)-threonylcarbamoyltransferase complex dimerization subunit type 1 TsaB [Gammaproteobacteria bacterium]|nr:tRNA (adenosine(37)-N6)-threonylcarbamoyltransferase complex dimerization subunit type 1 TsaB [Gammaproteobacteria bacterium]
MKILAIDTASDACSAALWLDGDIFERYELAPRQHTSLILPMVESLMADAGLSLTQLDAVAFGRGPGAFTGVRIATGVIQGLALGADLPVVPVSSLAALAQGASRIHRQKNILAAFDARMGEVYWGQYCLADNGLVELLGNELVCAPQVVPKPSQSLEWLAVGNGWRAYEDELNSVCQVVNISAQDVDYLPHAQDVAQLAVNDFKKGLAVSAEQALPVYLRDNVVRT